MCYSLGDKLLLERSIVERSLPRLINHVFTRYRLQLVNDIMPILPSHKQLPHWSLLPDNECMTSAGRTSLLSCQLWWWTIEERRLVALTSMNDGNAGVAPRLQHR